MVSIGARYAKVRLDVAHDFYCGRRSKEGADVDGHVEDGEGRIALRLELGVVVEVTHHYLQVAFEQARAHAHHEQRQRHDPHGHDAATRRDGEQQIAEEHNDNARRHTFSKTDLIGHDAAHKGQEINQCEKHRIPDARHALRPTEVVHQEEGEDGQHGVIAETLARVGQRQGIQTFWLSFKHKSNYLRL